VNDCASTAAQLISEAGRRGHHWDYLPIASGHVTASGPAGGAQKAVAGAVWLGRLAVAARSHDVVHVHSAGILRHARFALRRYVLHCHGTDVRTQQYQPAWRSAVRGGLDRAEAVLYSTPDLAEHVLPHRADATYLPVPIDVGLLPRWQPHRSPRVVFASRWGADKGGDQQVRLARAVVEAVGGRADVVGLDWGPLAGEARSAGVRLLPPTARSTYLDLLASAHAVVGQSAGILAASELEALGIGSPLVMPVALPLYASDAPPVLGGDVETAVDAVDALVEGTPHDPEPGATYVARVHGVDRALDVVLRTYDDVLRARG
jgi:hypothetical protein